MKTNIYLCTLDNGEEYEYYQNYTITVTGKDIQEAKVNAMAKFNGNIWGTGFGDSCIKAGGTLSVNLEYKNVILEEKRKKRKKGEHLWNEHNGVTRCVTCFCDEDDAFVGGQECSFGEK